MLRIVKRSVILRLSIIFLAAGMASQIFGCQTSPGEVPLCYLFEKTAVIFAGEIIKIEPKTIEYDNGGRDPKYKSWASDYNLVTFAVTDSFKNAKSEIVQVLFLAKSNSSCDTTYKVVIGERLLVLANKENKPHEEYVAAIAKREGDVDFKKTVSELTQIRDDGIRPSIYGQFQINYPLSMVKIKGFPVIAFAGKEMLTATMDEYGQFSFKNVVARKYTIRIFVPYDGYVLDDAHRKEAFHFDELQKEYFYEFDAMVPEGACVFQRISARPPDK